MGALLSLLLNSNGASGAKPFHHVETHFECACDDSSSSEDLQHEKEKHKETQTDS
jgi:hypothetical protein